MSDTDHVGSKPVGPGEVEPPEPSFAERARTLVRVARVGTLSTHSRKQAGFPFGSVMPFGLDGGRPTFLISTMAMHTQNLLADARASLLVTEPDWKEDPLAGPRLTLLGPVERAEPSATEAIRAEYLGRHPNAVHWVDFSDFAFYRMQVIDLYYVAGFGAMGWVSAEAYQAAAPDPLAESAAGILAHMNADHADALQLYCRAFGGVSPDAVTMVSVDRLGFRVRAQMGDQLRGLRFGFPREARTAKDAREVLIEMVREARRRLGAPGAAAPP